MPWEVYVCLLALVVIDYGTGVVGAIVNNNFSSSVMRAGLVHKMTYVVCFAVGFVINYMCGMIDLGYIYGASILSLMSVWVTITEVSSILENLCKINPELKDSAIFKIFAHEGENDEV